ncbi:hypothetical protein PR048_014823 [Dryococelus australis]|uniref:Uncharacterized protein n=1 Tax=Dryococelus australis TaxID=614101 RepID=A0ABQ9HFE3_9NEOP|nr:hypothetical protein PR048_014823 [Dryococelus australis]
MKIPAAMLGEKSVMPKSITSTWFILESQDNYFDNDRESLRSSLLRISMLTARGDISAVTAALGKEWEHVPTATRLRYIHQKHSRKVEGQNMCLQTTPYRAIGVKRCIHRFEIVALPEPTTCRHICCRKAIGTCSNKSGSTPSRIRRDCRLVSICSPVRRHRDHEEHKDLTTLVTSLMVGHTIAIGHGSTPLRTKAVCSARPERDWPRQHAKCKWCSHLLTPVARTMRHPIMSRSREIMAREDFCVFGIIPRLPHSPDMNVTGCPQMCRLPSNVPSEEFNHLKIIKVVTSFRVFIPSIVYGLGGGNGRSPRKLASKGIVRHDTHIRKSGVTRPGIEPGSPWWEASRLPAQPPVLVETRTDYPVCRTGSLIELEVFTCARARSIPNITQAVDSLPTVGSGVLVCGGRPGSAESLSPGRATPRLKDVDGGLPPPPPSQRLVPPALLIHRVRRWGNIYHPPLACAAKNGGRASLPANYTLFTMCSASEAEKDGSNRVDTATHIECAIAAKDVGRRSRQAGDFNSIFPRALRRRRLIGCGGRPPEGRHRGCLDPHLRHRPLSCQSPNRYPSYEFFTPSRKKREFDTRATGQQPNPISCRFSQRAPRVGGGDMHISSSAANGMCNRRPFSTASITDVSNYQTWHEIWPYKAGNAIRVSHYPVYWPLWRTLHKLLRNLVPFNIAFNASKLNSLTYRLAFTGKNFPVDGDHCVTHQRKIRHSEHLQTAWRSGCSVTSQLLASREGTVAFRGARMRQAELAPADNNVPAISDYDCRDGVHIGPVAPSRKGRCDSRSSVREYPSNEVKASGSMFRRRQRAPYQHGGRMIGLWETGLSYRDISARTGHTATTMMRVWNQWIEECRTQRRAGTKPRNVTTARDDLHLVCMAVTDRTASSTVLARHWSTATGVRRRFDTACCALDWWHANHCVDFHCTELSNASDCNGP